MFCFSSLVFALPVAELEFVRPSKTMGLFARSPSKPLAEQPREQVRAGIIGPAIVAGVFVCGAGFFVWQDRGLSFSSFACLFFAAFMFVPALPGVLKLWRRRHQQP